MKFFNVSNHPSQKWSQKQIDAAEEFLRKKTLGLDETVEILDIPFPNIPAAMSSDDVFDMSMEFAGKLLAQADISSDAFMVQGEFSFTYSLTNFLLARNADVVVATSERKVTEVEGKKIVEFEFVQFREVI